MKLSLNRPFGKVIFTFVIFFPVIGWTENVKPAAEDASSRIGEPVLLLPVVVQSTLLEDDLTHIPMRMSVVERARVNELIPQTLPDALRGQPGVTVSRTANGQATPIIRGFTGFRNLMLVDGIRLNNSVFREGANQYFATIDSYLAERIEVLQGPTSVIFGTDAVGGTVNVVTQSPKALEEAAGQSFAHGLTQARYSSGEQSYQSHVASDFGVGQQWGIHLGLSWKDFGNVIAAGIGDQPKTGFEELSWDVKFQFHPDVDSTLTLAFQQTVIDDVWRTHSTQYALPWRGTIPGTDQVRTLDQTRRLSYLQYEGEMDGPVQKMRASLSWHQQIEQQERVRKDGRRNESDFEVNTLGFWLDLDSATPLGYLVYGGGFYSDDIDTRGVNYSATGVPSLQIQGPVADDSRYDIAGLFIQDQVDLSDAVSLHLGIRYDQVRAQAGRFEDPTTGDADSLNESWDSLVSSARLLWKKGEFSAFGGVSQSFRAPNLSDLTRFDSARSGEIETPSPAISPEHFLTYEIGSRWARSAAQLGLNLFYTRMRDLIVRTPTGKIIGDEREVTKTNGGKGYLMGIEFDASLPIGRHLSLYGNFAWTDGEEEHTERGGIRVKEATNRLIPWTANAGLRCQFNRAFWMALELEAAAKADKLSTSNRLDTERIPPGGTPGFAILHLRAGWQVNDHLSLNATLENLTNGEYRVHGSGINQPGINAVVAATLRF
jgi:hemoglobin/transferrin/lactoferrin receptor protein